MSIKEFGTKMLLDNHWVVDLIAGLIVSIGWSRLVQTGQENNQYSLIAVFTGFASYLLVCLLSFQSKRIHVLVWIPLIGSVIYAFNWMVIYFLIFNWDPVRKAETMSNYLSRMPAIILPRFILAAVLFSAAALTLSLAFRAFVTVIWPLEES